MCSHGAARPEHLPEEPAAQAVLQFHRLLAPMVAEHFVHPSTKHQAAGISWVAGGGMSTSEATEKFINRCVGKLGIATDRRLMGICVQIFNAKLQVPAAHDWGLSC